MLAATVSRISKQDFSENVDQLHPGDFCVLLRAKSVHATMTSEGSECEQSRKQYHCLLTSSPLLKALGLSAERLVWVNIEASENGRATLRYVGTANFTEINLLLKDSQGSLVDSYEDGTPRNSGYLSDGSRYLVYRFSFPIDGFSPTKAMRYQRSVGVCDLPRLVLSL